MKTNIRRFIAAPLAVAGFAFLLAGTANALPTVDLTTAGNSGVINGALFSTNDIQPTGTGVIDPFLRLQANHDETGLNSGEGTGDLLLDTKSGIWTNDILLGAIGKTMVGGVEVYAFLLDINQTSVNSLLSLDTIQFYTRATTITDGAPDTLAAVQAGGVLRYDMDAAPDGPSWVLLDYNLNSGSGSGDMYLYVPTSNFAGALETDFLYLYTQFGLQAGEYASNDGFEEWAAMNVTVEVPDGGTTVLLIGGVLLLMPFVRRFLS